MTYFPRDDEEDPDRSRGVVGFLEKFVVGLVLALAVLGEVAVWIFAPSYLRISTAVTVILVAVVAYLILKPPLPKSVSGKF
jgi:membrane protein YdbS with pleckstrin-like domain